MATLIAIDCSGESCSVALLHGDSPLARHSSPGIRQSEQVLVWVEELLKASGLSPASIDGLAVTIGPGAFTGVRLAVATVQGLAMAWDRPVVPVSTLAALAAMVVAPVELPVLAVMDARMGEVYAGWFAPVRDAAAPVAIADEVVTAPDRIVRPDGVSAYIAIGSAFPVHSDAISRALGEPAMTIRQDGPDALAVARLARHQWPHAARSPDQLVPAYLRNKVALTTAERLAGKN